MIDVDFTSRTVEFKIQFRFQLDTLYFVKKLYILDQAPQTSVPPIHCMRPRTDLTLITEWG
jgi:hypothetical protein